MNLADQFELAAKITRENLEWEWCDLDGVWRTHGGATLLSCIHSKTSFRIKEQPPLGPLDFPPGSFLREQHALLGAYLSILSVDSTHVMIPGQRIPFKEVRQHKWQILRPGKTEWENV